MAKKQQAKQPKRKTQKTAKPKGKRMATVKKYEPMPKALDAQKPELVAELESIETTPQLAKDDVNPVTTEIEANKAAVKFLEEEILPKAKTMGFKGVCPVVENGKLVVKKVNNVGELEALIDNLKKGRASAGVIPQLPTEIPKEIVEQEKISESYRQRVLNELMIQREEEAAKKAAEVKPPWHHGISKWFKK